MRICPTGVIKVKDCFGICAERGQHMTTPDTEWGLILSEGCKTFSGKDKLDQFSDPPKPAEILAMISDFPGKPLSLWG